MNLFGKKKQPKQSPKEAARAAKRETQREVRRNQRDIDRELRELERTEKQVTADIKKRARNPNINPATDSSLKTLAKHLVQVRQQKSEMIDARAQLGAVGMHAANMATQVAAANAIGNVSSAMAAANDAVDTKEMAKVMAQFQRENEVMNVREEMMDDAFNNEGIDKEADEITAAGQFQRENEVMNVREEMMDDAFNNEGIDEEADEITAQVLAELGLEMDQQMAGLNAPAGRLAQQQGRKEDDELMDALPDLRSWLDAL
eukprot:CAMPEP_0172518588 /NCGR_PEP_ID=MMETSP1066-20121228/290901_1 /TAXON_ID=671091 /ORGANISM="Coscinodiscus wailesii, Strain CCMP2513" /LENGTH=259 /DNA_ID=CAMNT_0013301007 /DNA_START=824 /DNA_END=1602 /DNA_ORIENTATION=+